MYQKSKKEVTGYSPGNCNRRKLNFISQKKKPVLVLKRSFCSDNNFQYIVYWYEISFQKIAEHKKPPEGMLTCLLNKKRHDDTAKLICANF